MDDYNVINKRLLFLKSILLLVLLAVAGLAANYFRYEIVFNIQFIFGSIFAMLALQLFGLSRGVIVGAIISGYTYVLWNHPYAIIIMTAEVLVVGLLTGRKKIGLVLADALYWLVLGMPLVVLFYYGAMHLSMHTAIVTMLKQATNGIANALIARLLYVAVSRTWMRESFSLRELLFDLLVLFCMMPSLYLIARASTNDMIDLEQQIRNTLIQSSTRTEHEINVWLDHQIKQVDYIAWMATSFSSAIIQKNIEQIHRNNKDFLRIGLCDRNATVTAYSPLVDELGQFNIGRNFKDRPYIPIMKQTLKPMMSEVVMGRIGVPKPIATAVAPVVVHGRYAGYAIGILNLDNVNSMFHLFSQSSSLPEWEYILIDRNNKVVVSSKKTLPTMTTFIREKGELSKIDNAVYLWVPYNFKNISISDRWKKAYYFIEMPIGGISGWRVILEQPMAPFQKLLYERYAVQLAVIFIILLGAVVVAEILSQGVTRELRMLGTLSTGLPARLIKEQTVEWPSSSVTETQQLIENIGEMSAELSHQFNEVRTLNQTLEDRIMIRTQELTESEEKYRAIFNNEIYSICIFDLETGCFLDVNPAYEHTYGYSRKELLGGMTIHTITTEQRDTNATIQQAVREGAIFIPLRYHRKKDGTLFPVEIVGSPYEWKGKKVMFALAHDISKRKQAEEAVQEKTLQLEELTKNLEQRIEEELSIRHKREQLLFQQSKLAVMGEMLGAIAHQWRQPLNVLGLNVQNIRDSYAYGELEKELLEQLVQASMAQINHMSKTIDDFRNFFRPDKEKATFNTMQAVGDVFSLFSAELFANNIRYKITCNAHSKTFDNESEISCCDTNVVVGYRNEFEHVILNLINNSRDAIIERWNAGTMPITEHGLITFNFSSTNTTVSITVSDNGGGINPDILDRIFEPYYTTKGPIKGSGLGLYMSKIIIEHMDGRLSADNGGHGAVFTIELPRGEQHGRA